MKARDRSVGYDIRLGSEQYIPRRVFRTVIRDDHQFNKGDPRGRLIRRRNKRLQSRNNASLPSAAFARHSHRRGRTAELISLGLYSRADNGASKNSRELNESPTKGERHKAHKRKRATRVGVKSAAARNIVANERQ